MQADTIDFICDTLADELEGTHLQGIHLDGDVTVTRLKADGQLTYHMGRSFAAEMEDEVYVLRSGSYDPDGTYWKEAVDVLDYAGVQLDPYKDAFDEDAFDDVVAVAADLVLADFRSRVSDMDFSKNLGG